MKLQNFVLPIFVAVIAAACGSETEPQIPTEVEVKLVPGFDRAVVDRSAIAEIEGTYESRNHIKRELSANLGPNDLQSMARGMRAVEVANTEVATNGTLRRDADRVNPGTQQLADDAGSNSVCQCDSQTCLDQWVDTYFGCNVCVVFNCDAGSYSHSCVSCE